MTDDETGQHDAFIFIPLPKNTDTKEADKALRVATWLGKHTLKADRALGITFRRDGSDFLIDWALVQKPWEPDAELDALLRVRSPFRPLEGGFRPHYHFRP